MILPKDCGILKFNESAMAELLDMQRPLLSKCLHELIDKEMVKRSKQGFYLPQERRKNHALREQIRKAFEAKMRPMQERL